MRCKFCGSKAIYPYKNREGFSVGKAIAGTITFGAVGAVAGLAGKNVNGYRCSACGTFSEKAMDIRDEMGIDSAIAHARNGDTYSYDRCRERYVNIEIVPIWQPSTPVQPTHHVALPHTPQAVISETASVCTPAAPIVKHTYCPNQFSVGDPIFVSNVTIQEGSDSDLLLLDICNISGKTVRSVYLNVTTYDDVDDQISTNTFVYQGLSSATGTHLPQPKPFKLNTNVAYKVDISCEKAAFTDDTVWRKEDSQTVYPMLDRVALVPESFSQYKYLRTLLSQKTPLSKDHKLYYPAFEENYRLCVCGNPVVRGNRCLACGLDESALYEIMDYDVLIQCRKNVILRAAKERTAALETPILQAKEKKYQKAVKLRDTNKLSDYQTAEKIFSAISGHQDADEQADYCRTQIARIQEETEAARKNSIYNAGWKKMHQPYATVNDLQYAISEFIKIPGWKNADEQIVICQQKIDEIKAKKEAERLEQERQAERRRLAEKKRARRKKVTAVVFTLLALAAIAFFVFLNNVIIPNEKYNNALAMMDAGQYQEAISAFNSLGEYKDSRAKIETCNQLLEKAQRDAQYLQAQALVQDKQYEEADLLLQQLRYIDGYADKVQQLYRQMVDQCRNDGQYDLAVSMYKHINGFSEESEEYKDLVYHSGLAAMERGDYLNATVAFKNIPGYLDADTQLLEANYQRAQDYIQRGMYDQAVTIFENMGNYKDCQSQLLDLKYQYVQAHFTNSDQTTHAYLKSLKAAQYKDSVAIWDELYSWKISLLFVNTTKEDFGTSLSFIPTSSSYLHMSFALTGGEPGEKITIYHTYQWPGEKAYTSDWMWENNISGDRLGIEWSRGVSVSSGTFVMRFFNSTNNELIATISIPVGKSSTTTMKPGGSHGDVIVLESSGFFVTANAGVLVSSTGSSKDVLELTTSVASAARFTIRKNSDGTITFVAANGKFLMADGNDVQLVSKENDYTKFIIEKTNGGVFVRCAVASYAGKPQYLEIYHSKLTCYGMDATYAERYLFQLLIP